MKHGDLWTFKDKCNIGVYTYGNHALSGKYTLPLATIETGKNGEKFESIRYVDPAEAKTERFTPFAQDAA